MARRVYFSFHYDVDINRVNTVRHSQQVRAAADEVGFFDHGLWEETKLRGDAAIEALIDEGMKGAGVTAVLIGAQTALRRWVDYEIKKSWVDRKGLVGVCIHQIKDMRTQRTSAKGPNPFDTLYLETAEGKRYLSSIFKTYDWVSDMGYQNIATWLDEAVELRKSA